MAKEPKGVQPTSVRLTPTGLRLWDELAGRLGISKAALLEMMLRERARAEGISTEVSAGEHVAA